MCRKILIGTLLLASVLECIALTSGDEAIMRRIVTFLMPQCGGNRTTRIEHAPELIDVLNINGDVDRLARLLAELAQTNDAWYAEMAMWQLEKYGTSAQLPFLYTCATNPVYGDRAVKAVLRIEGVTSNSVEMLHSYLTFTNSITRQQAYNRAVVCTDFLDCLRDSCAVLSLKEWTYQVVRSFAADINTSNSIVDQALIVSDDAYRYSKRRLAVMRAAYPRCFNEYQTNYVTNAISELVAYPEANLPE